MALMTKDEAVAKGMHFACTECQNTYADIPHDLTAFWVEGKDIPQCDCGCYHLVDLREVDNCVSLFMFHERPVS